MLMMNDMMNLRVIIHSKVQSHFQLQSLTKKYKPTAFAIKFDIYNKINIECNKE